MATCASMDQGLGGNGPGEPCLGGAEQGQKQIKNTKKEIKKKESQDMLNRAGIGPSPSLTPRFVAQALLLWARPTRLGHAAQPIARPSQMALTICF
ncbi:hypothetical protein AMTRI_Chr03g144980 [Amborella trichopoda]